MEIKEITIPIRELIEGYVDNDEDGVFSYGGKLNIRPPYQRELVYDTKEQIAVINSILKGFPLNVMYWMSNTDGNYELLDGQQRTLSICRFCDGVYSINIDGNPKWFNNLSQEIKNKILNYKLNIYLCDGTADERTDWFRVINFAGKKLTNQELLNAMYNGPWINNAKYIFSKTNCYAYKLANRYMNGAPIRQDYLETVIKWVCDRDNIPTVKDYMALHQYDENAEDLMNYFTEVIEWIESLFSTYRKQMKGIPWGILYNKYHDNIYDSIQLEERISNLMADYEVTNKSGVYEYVLSDDERCLSLRQFDDAIKVAQYEIQEGKCFLCGESFEYKDMHGDHWIPWSKGGKTVAENCKMLCVKCNIQKSAHNT